MLDRGVGELLPGWRQQDLLGATGPGLLEGGEHRAGGKQRRGEDVNIEGQRWERKEHFSAM